MGINAYTEYLISDISFCATTTTNPSVTTVPRITTLASELRLVESSKVYIIAIAILAGIPIAVVICCVVRSIIQHRREKKITDEDDPNFQHPPPSHPFPQHFLQRDNTITGPFMNPAFADDDDIGDDRSRVVTPSFVSTQVVNEPGFGIPREQRRYKYIP